MDEYNWDDWDAQASEYVNSDAYQSPETLDMTQFQGGQSYAPNSAMSNVGYVDQSSPEMSQADWGNMPNMDMFPQSSGQQMDYGMSLDPNGVMARLLQGGTQSYGMSTPSVDLPNNQPNNFNFGGVSNVLSNIFSGQNGGFAAKGLAALLEGSQNKKKAAMMQQLAQQFRTNGDPFGSQRPFYQQQLQQTVQDPYSAPIVKNQVDALAQAQAIKDAAAGRRSNSMTSAPQLLAAQAKVAQDYMNSLQTPAGANIKPDLSGYISANTAGINANINGYTSPISQAVNDYTSHQQLLDLLSKLKGQ